MKEILKKYTGILGVSLIIISCGGGDDDGPPPLPPNEAPSTVESLIFPSPNLLCIDNNVAFDWSDAEDPEGGSVRYRIVIATDRDLTDIVEDRIVNQSNVTITLVRNTAFYWNITSLDNANAESDPTPTQAFFTMGEGEVNNVPFTAALVSPEDQNDDVIPGAVILEWQGADTDTEDTLTYDVFFGTDPMPGLATGGENISEQTFPVTTIPATTYYWRINTTDDSGATSIGRVWQFTTN